MFGSWRLVWLAKKGGGQVIFGKHFMEHFIKHSKIGMCKEEQRIFGRPRGGGGGGARIFWHAVWKSYIRGGS